VDDVPIVAFATRDDLWAWLADRGCSPDDAGVWVRLTKGGSPEGSVTFHDLLEAGIAHGWSESTRRAYDAHSYLQRFSPRRTRGTRSERNLRLAAALEARGLMTDAGRRALSPG
jgi:uncharacterized protein YdeI (YjbR/CyaY-like superfamily)